MAIHLAEKCSELTSGYHIVIDQYLGWPCIIRDAFHRWYTITPVVGAVCCCIWKAGFLIHLWATTHLHNYRHCPIWISICRWRRLDSIWLLFSPFEHTTTPNGGDGEWASIEVHVMCAAIAVTVLQPGSIWWYRLTARSEDANCVWKMNNEAVGVLLNSLKIWRSSSLLVCYGRP